MSNIKFIYICIFHAQYVLSIVTLNNVFRIYFIFYNASRNNIYLKLFKMVIFVLIFQIPSNFVLNSYPEGDAIYKKTDVQVTSSNSIAVNYTYQENKSSGSNYYSEIRDNTRNNLDNRTDCSNSSNSINPSNFYENDIREKIIDNMASRDRTQEFTRIIRSQQGNLVNGSIKYKEGKRPKDFRQYGEFMQRAK